MEKKLCYICSPYRGDTTRNIQYAQELTQALDDADPAPFPPLLVIFRGPKM